MHKDNKSKEEIPAFLKEVIVRDITGNFLNADDVEYSKKRITEIDWQMRADDLLRLRA